MAQEDEVFQGFIEEAREHLQTMEEELLAIEEAGNEADDDTINRVFRAAHTIKGGAGFFGLENVQNLSHSMENLLNLIRDHQINLSSGIISLLLQGQDLLGKMLDAPDQSNDMDISEVLDRLKASGGGGQTAEHSATNSDQTENTSKPSFNSNIGFCNSC